MDQIFWFFVKSFRSIGKNDIHYESGVYKGSFTDLVLMIACEKDTDQHYTDFNLVTWKELTEDEYLKLDSYI